MTRSPKVIRVDDEESGGHAAWWVLGGLLVGIAAGVLIAERANGRELSARSILKRARRWVERALDDEEEDPLHHQRASGTGAAYADDLDEFDDELDEEGVEAADGDAASSGGPADGSLDTRVLEAFANDPVLAERPIEIEEVEGSGILLHGQVRTAREVAHAVTIARGVPGVHGVKQRLRVRDRR